MKQTNTKSKAFNSMKKKIKIKYTLNYEMKNSSIKHTDMHENINF